MRIPITAIAAASLALFLVESAAAQKTVSFPTEDGGVIYADVYGEGGRAVVLAHGGRFNKESWEKQARTLASAGFRVLALDFRGYGKSQGPGQSAPMSAPLHLDVLGAVRYLRKTGAKSVSVVESPTLFIVARDDRSGDGPRLPGIRQQYDKAPQPKSLIILEGSAHAQYLFQTDQAERVMREILQFLSAK